MKRNPIWSDAEIDLKLAKNSVSEARLRVRRRRSPPECWHPPGDIFVVDFSSLFFGHTF